LLHDTQDRIADALGLLFQAGKVDVLDPALAHDLACGVFGDDAEARLARGQARPRNRDNSRSSLRRKKPAASPAC